MLPPLTEEILWDAARKVLKNHEPWWLEVWFPQQLPFLMRYKYQGYSPAIQHQMSIT